MSRIYQSHESERGVMVKCNGYLQLAARVRFYYTGKRKIIYLVNCYYLQFRNQ